MSAISPSYLRQPGGGNSSGSGSHPLSDEEYAIFLQLLPFPWLLTDTDGRIVTTNSGEFVFGTH